MLISTQNQIFYFFLRVKFSFKQTEFFVNDLLIKFFLGTDFTENTLSKSNQYADKHSLSRFQYVLHPRTKGFCFFVNTLRKGLHLIF